MQNKNIANVSILDKQYQVACSQDGQEALALAANELDARMRAIRSSGSIIGLERIAVMAALNLSHELLQTTKSLSISRPADQDALERIAKKLDHALD